MFRRIVAILLSIMLIIPGALVPSFAAPKVSAKLISMKGDVQVIRAGGERPFKAFVNMRLTEGDRIITASKSSAKIEMDDQVVVTLASNTRAYLSELRGSNGAKQSSIGLQSGGIGSSIKKKITGLSRFQIKTPTAVMGVRGTEFFTQYYNGNADIRVVDGEVEVRVNLTDKGEVTGLGASTENTQTFILSSLKQVSFDEGKIVDDITRSIEPLKLEGLSVELLERVKEIDLEDPALIPKDILDTMDQALEAAIKLEEERDSGVDMLPYELFEAKEGTAIAGNVSPSTPNFTAEEARPRPTYPDYSSGGGGSTRPSVPETPDIIEGEFIDFPDKALEEALLASGRVDTNEDGKISLGEAKAVKNYLYLPSVGNSDCYTSIKNLSGLEYFTNLEQLDLGHHEITDIGPILELNNLKHLYLGTNKIQNIKGISKLAKLISISLGDNQITDISPLADIDNLIDLDIGHNNFEIDSLISLSNLTNLYNLGLGNNNHIGSIEFLEDFNNLFSLRLGRSNTITNIERIKNLDNLKHLSSDGNHNFDIDFISEMTQLTSLSLNNNQDLDLNLLSDLVNLEQLNLYGNQIEDISPLLGLTKLTDLDLYNNEITDISPLSNLKELTYLNVSYNKLGALNLSGLENLRQLVLYNNQISDIGQLSDLRNLTSLDLDRNQISNIGQLSELTNLTSLYLGDNEIKDISSLSSLKNLEHLALHDNQISGVEQLSGLENLTSLDLDRNQISSIGQLSELTNLTSLYLGYNKIGDISPLLDMINLSNLNLGGNQIGDISPLSDLTNLRNLNLRDNEIDDIGSLSGLVNLTSLELYNNNITDIDPLSGLTNLTSLNLFSNNIKDISPLLDLTNLRNLNLRDNEIDDISSLSGLVNLTSLDLSNNNIADIDPLSGLTNLTSLNLSSNNIEDISPLVGKIYCNYIYLQDNDLLYNDGTNVLLGYIGSGYNEREYEVWGKPTSQLNKYELTLEGDGISSEPGPGLIDQGTEITITIEEVEGEELVAFFVNGEDRISELVEGQYIFTLEEDTEVEVEYEPISIPVTQYSLSLIGEGLSSEPEPGLIDEGTEVIITITLSEGQQVGSFIVNNESKLDELEDNQYKFNLNEDTIVRIIYEETPIIPVDPEEPGISYVGYSASSESLQIAPTVVEYIYDENKFTVPAHISEFVFQDGEEVKRAQYTSGEWSISDLSRDLDKAEGMTRILLVNHKLQKTGNYNNLAEKLGSFIETSLETDSYVEVGVEFEDVDDYDQEPGGDVWSIMGIAILHLDGESIEVPFELDLVVM